MIYIQSLPAIIGRISFFVIVIYFFRINDIAKSGHFSSNGDRKMETYPIDGGKDSEYIGVDLVVIKGGKRQPADS